MYDRRHDAVRPGGLRPDSFKSQAAGLNFFRAWGGGLAETDAFYDLCDEYGLCVYQEWPCCWDSQKQQPKDAAL